MITTGLLWYDDDTHRPLAVKIADAAERFRERVGFEPTVCQLNPALAQQATTQREQPKRRSRKLAQQPVIEIPVRLEPSESLRPNYFFVGVLEGEKLKRVRGWQSPDQIDSAPRARPTKTRRVSSPAPTATKQATKATRATARQTSATTNPAHVAATPAPVAAAPTSGTETSAPVAAKSSRGAAKTSRKAAGPTGAATPIPAPTPKISATAPTRPATREAPKSTRTSKNAATPATPAAVPTPVAQPLAQPTTRSRRPATPTATRPAVAVSATPASPAAQTSLWGDLPPAAPTRKRKSA